MPERDLPDNSTETRGRYIDEVTNPRELISLLQDSDAIVVNVARARLKDLLVQDEHPTTGKNEWQKQRLACIADLQDSDTLLILAQSRHPEIAQLSLEKIKTQHGLVEVALDATLPEIRTQAVTGIYDSEALKYLQADSRGHDKVVYQKANQRQQKILKATQEHQKLIKEAEDLLVAFNDHAKSRDPILYQQKLNYHERQCDSKIKQLTEATQCLLELQQTFDKQILSILQYKISLATDNCTAVFVQLKTADEISEKTSTQPSFSLIINELKDFFKTLYKSEIEPENGSKTILELERFNVAWSKELNKHSVTAELEDEWQKLQQKVQLLQSALILYQSLVHRYIISMQYIKQFADQDIETLSDTQLPSLIQQVKSTKDVVNEMRADLTKFKWPAEAPVPNKIAEISEFIQKWEIVAKAVKSHFDAIRHDVGEKIDSLQARISSGKIGVIAELKDVADEISKQLKNLDRTSMQKQRNTFDSILHEIEKYSDWQLFATDKHHQELLKKIQELPESDLSLPQRAKKIKEIRAKWRELDKIAMAPNDLWKKFSTAADEAYKPCKEFFAEQDKLRETNFQQRQNLCAELEGFVADGNANKMNLRLANKALNTAGKMWREYYPVRHNEELDRRFKDAVKNLHNLLEKKREEFALLDSARSLVDNLERDIATWESLPNKDISASLNLQAISKTREALDKIENLPRHVIRKTNYQLEQFQKRINALNNKVKVAKKSASVTLLLEVMESLNAGIIPEDGALQQVSLVKKSLSSILDTRSKAKPMNAQQGAEVWRKNCVNLELLVGLETPVVDQEIRRKIRTEKLLQKFQDGNKSQATIETLLEESLELPAIAQDEAKKYLARIHNTLLSYLKA